MLNLLIAIISDSFEKEMAQERHAKTYERLHLIIETLRTLDEKEISKFNKLYQNKYIYLIEREDLETSEDQTERLRNKIDRLETIVSGFSTELKKNLDKFEIGFAEMQKKQAIIDENLQKNQVLIDQRLIKGFETLGTEMQKNQALIEEKLNAFIKS